MSDEQKPPEVGPPKLHIVDLPELPSVPGEKPLAEVVPITLKTPPPTPKDENPFSMIVSQQQVESLDLNALRDKMVKGIYTIEAALFSQAGLEYNRAQKDRDLMVEVEKLLFTTTELAKLTPSEKIMLYRTVQQSKQSSLGFLQALHGNITTGIDAISHIEKLKNQATAQAAGGEVKDGEKVTQVKALILEKLKGKLGVK